MNYGTIVVLITYDIQILHIFRYFIYSDTSSQNNLIFFVSQVTWKQHKILHSFLKKSNKTHNCLFPS